MAISTLNLDLKQPENELDKFVYSVSHDLQEPLRMVTSFLKLLDSRFKDNIPEDGERYLEMAMENAERMKEMIYGLVDLSRVNRTQEQLEVVNLKDLMVNITAMYQTELREKKVVLKYDTPDTVIARPMQISQVFKCLFQNVIDHAEGEQIQFVISYTEEDGFYHFQFTDSGKPIKPVYLDKVFEMFKKINPNSTGVGVGLSLAREIIRFHGGAMWATADAGTTFHFTLPIAVQ
ncbi:MAG: sensor histidine kinase [Flavobacteriales bacterium]